MGMKSRNKGKTGEREIAAIVRDVTGWDVKRKVRQLDGESDLEGIPGWSVEVKRHKTATRGEIAEWWGQTQSQASMSDEFPVLFYRKDRDEWRAVWPLVLLIGIKHGGTWHDYPLTVEGSVDAWSVIAREVVNSSMEVA